MIVYLAYPVDHANGKHLSAVTELSRRIGRNHTLYEPGVCWYTHGEPDARMQGINDLALERCDALVAYYPDLRSTGVPYEIGRARALGIATCVIAGDETRASWALVGCGAEIVPDGRAAVEWLDKLDEIAWAGAPEPAQAKVRHLDENLGLMPFRAHDGDAGFDLYVSETITLPAGQFTNVRSHLAVEWPEGVWGLLVGRSSTFYQRNLVTNTAIIDNGFRGELFACVYNPGPENQVAVAGERLVQIIPMPLLAPSIQMVPADTLTPSDRGEKGFGSTGS